MGVKLRLQQNKKNEVGGACCTNGRGEKYMQGVGGEIPK
jgi:hypothetical protein